MHRTHADSPVTKSDPSTHTQEGQPNSLKAVQRRRTFCMSGFRLLTEFWTGGRFAWWVPPGETIASNLISDVTQSTQYLQTIAGTFWYSGYSVSDAEKRDFTCGSSRNPDLRSSGKSKFGQRTPHICGSAAACLGQAPQLAVDGVLKSGPPRTSTTVQRFLKVSWRFCCQNFHVTTKIYPCKQTNGLRIYPNIFPSMILIG